MGLVHGCHDPDDSLIWPWVVETVLSFFFFFHDIFPCEWLLLYLFVCGMTLVYEEDDHMTSFNAAETLFHSP
jgi:membrane-bound ClpP family serine protease